MKFKINERIKIDVCRSEMQQCVWCGLPVHNRIAIDMSNKTDGLILHKNLWLHIECLPKFSSTVKRYYKKREGEIIAVML